MKAREGTTNKNISLTLRKNGYVFNVSGLCSWIEGIEKRGERERGGAREERRVYGREREGEIRKDV